jgi:hypothetical protein
MPSALHNGTRFFGLNLPSLSVF